MAERLEIQKLEQSNQYLPTITAIRSVIVKFWNERVPYSVKRDPALVIALGLKKLVLDGILLLDVKEEENEVLNVLIKPFGSKKVLITTLFSEFSPKVHINDFLDVYKENKYGVPTLFEILNSDDLHYIVEYNQKPEQNDIVNHVITIDQVINHVPESLTAAEKIDELIDMDTVDMSEINAQIVCIGKYREIGISEYDYSKLSSHVWVTPSLVDFGMSYFYDSYFLCKDFRNSVFLANTFLFECFKLLKEREEKKGKISPALKERINGITGDTDIFSKKNIFIPILYNFHFRLIHATYSEVDHTVSLYYYDSAFQFVVYEIIEVIKFFFGWQFRKNNAIDILKFKIIRVTTPAQSEGDCGIFVIAFFKMLILNGQLSNFTGSEATQLRKNMAYILRTKVIDKDAKLPELIFDE